MTTFRTMTGEPVDLATIGDDVDAVIPMTDASEYDRKHYGITHYSLMTYEMTDNPAEQRAAYRLHNPRSQHRIKVWDNTGRPNTDPDKWNEFSGKPGPGKYRDPHGKGTDAETSVLTSAQATVISAYRTGTEVVRADGPLTVGQRVRLLYPDGLLSDVYVITTALPLHDPDLIPEN